MAMFTNMTQDHLDFHKTLGEYAEARASLFSLASQAGSKTGKHAVINADDPAADVMRDAEACDILTRMGLRMPKRTCWLKMFR